MLVMVIEAFNLEEQPADKKFTLDRLLKESAQIDVQIKHQNKQLVDLAKMLGSAHLKHPKKAQTVRIMTKSPKSLMMNA